MSSSTATPSRVGVKRGPYRPREKPNWNKDILQQERAEKKKAQKLEAKRLRAKPPPVKPLPPITSLPAEVLDIIVMNILPTAHPLADHLPDPNDTPYPPSVINVTAGCPSKLERWGSIPQSVFDIINFGKCCRQTMRAVERVVGGLGGYTAEQAPAGTLDAVRSDEKRQLFLRLSHCKSTGDDLLAFAMRSRLTLEHVVLHHCGGEHGRTQYANQLELADASPIDRTNPLQLSQPPDHVPLPRLRSLQIGPDVCVECSQACLSLFTGKTFISKASDAGTPQFLLTRTHGGYGGWTSTVFDTVAAPELVAIQIHVANPVAKYRHYGSEYSPLFERLIDPDLRNKIQTFSMILPSNERKWGGFGVSGHSSSVHQKSREEAEKELVARARAEMVAPGLSNPHKALDSKTKEKWAAMAKAALVKPAPQPSKSAAEDFAAALVSSIKPKAPANASTPATLSDVSVTPPSPPSSTKSITRPRPLPAAKAPTTSEYDRQVIANRTKLHQQFKQLLRDIAAAFPNLVSLQVLRRGNARVDMVEDLLPIEEYAEIYVTPLRKLHCLEHLDLGLAVVGRREVRDFPLGFSIPECPSKDEMEMRRKILERDIFQATREGDAWREKVLIRFVVGTGEDTSADLTFSNPPANLAEASEDAPVKLPTGWPRGVKTGFVYLPELNERVMYRGVLATWERGTEAWRVDKSKEGVIFVKSQEKEKIFFSKSAAAL